jgi:hypothetical protein
MALLTSCFFNLRKTVFVPLNVCRRKVSSRKIVAVGKNVRIRCGNKSARSLNTAHQVTATTLSLQNALGALNILSNLHLVYLQRFGLPQQVNNHSKTIPKLTSEKPCDEGINKQSNCFYDDWTIKRFKITLFFTLHCRFVRNLLF